jgi:hypothetical protein
MRRDRSTSFLLVARRSTIKLPYVFPSRTIAPVVSMLSTILVAVPAFRRVEPLITSGPTTGVIRTAGQGRVPVAAQPDGVGFQLSGVLQPGQHVGRAPAGGDAHHHVGLAKPDFLQIVDRKFGMIFGALDRPDHRRRPAGDDSQDPFGVGLERGRAFGGIEHAEPARGARAEVDQPAALAEPVGDDLDRPSNRFGLPAHGLGDLSVLGVHQPDDFQGREAVDPLGRGISAFGGQTRKLTHCSTWALKPEYWSQQSQMQRRCDQAIRPPDC